MLCMATIKPRRPISLFILKKTYHFSLHISEPTPKTPLFTLSTGLLLNQQREVLARLFLFYRVTFEPTRGGFSPTFPFFQASVFRHKRPILFPALGHPKVYPDNTSQSNRYLGHERVHRDT